MRWCGSRIPNSGLKWYSIALLLTVPCPKLLSFLLFSIRETSLKVLTPWENYEFETHRQLPIGSTRIQRIHCAVVVKCVYCLSLRAAQGFVSSVMRLLRLDLSVPNYNTISRRQGTLSVPLSLSSGCRPRHIVIAATGLRVYGAGGVVRP